MTEPAPARLAATLLIVRDGADGFEVFMVARHRQVDFASGALVFPGGRVEPEDAALGGEAYDERERAMRVGAIRETFEECGVLLARAKGEASWLDGARASAILAGAKGATFGEIVARENLELGLEALTPFAHWITPKTMPKRFDTAFYIVEAPEGQIARHDGSESVDSVWINPARAIEEAARGIYTLVPATKLNLQMLAESDSVAAALKAARERRIVPVEPRPEKTPTGLRLHIPIEAGYGVAFFEVERAPT
jgi:8-oxo-dGTP pyrophosphatase MutT (NUDIX family)